MTTSEVDDFFEKPGAANLNEPPRDHQGRYLLPDPRDGKSRSWQRATTLAKTLEDTYHLGLWKQRQTLIGISARPDLYALAASTPATDKKTLDKVAADACEAAGSSTGANMGTALHGFTGILDRREDVKAIPEQFREDVKAYHQALHNAGIEPLPKYVERTGLNLDFETAGTFDRVYRMPNGDLVIGDLKTQKTMDFGVPSIGIQLALYANFEVLRDFETGQYEKMPDVRRDYAIVVHLPVGEATARIIRIDTALGYWGARLARDARNYRSMKSIASPWVPGFESPRISVVNPPDPGFQDNSVAHLVTDQPLNGVPVDAAQLISPGAVAAATDILADGDRPADVVAAAERIVAREAGPTAVDAVSPDSPLTRQQTIDELAKMSKQHLQAELRKIDPSANVSRYRKDLAAAIIDHRLGNRTTDDEITADQVAVEDLNEADGDSGFDDNAMATIAAAKADAPPDPVPTGVSSRPAVLEAVPDVVSNPFADPEPEPEQEIDLKEPYRQRMAVAQSRGELAAIWDELVKAGLQDSELQALGGKRMAVLKAEGKA